MTLHMMHATIGLDPVTVCLAVGGAIGPALRGVIAPGQSWRSRQTGVDVVLGALLGVLLPVLPLDRLGLPIPTLPAGWTPLQYGAGMTVVTYALGDVLRERLLNRWRSTATPQDRRAGDPPAPPPAP